jgi:hypothetical protein
MRRVGKDFLRSAPSIVTRRQHIALDRQRVFEHLAQAETWPRWHPFITGAEWMSPGPWRVGATRKVHLNARYYAYEDLLEWDEGRRLTLRYVESDVPVLNAFAEDLVLKDGPDGGCTLSWTIATESSGLLKPIAPVITRVNAGVLERALHNLAETLA